MTNGGGGQWDFGDHVPSVPPFDPVFGGSGAPDLSGAAPGGLGQPTNPSAGQPVRAPVVWLGAAGVSVLASLGIGSQSSMRPALAVLAWVLGGFVAVSLLALFTVQDCKRRASEWYVKQRWTSSAQLAIGLLAAAAVAVSATYFAIYAGRTWSR
jgi:hypothetical protein